MLEEVQNLQGFYKPQTFYSLKLIEYKPLTDNGLLIKVPHILLL